MVGMQTGETVVQAQAKSVGGAREQSPLADLESRSFLLAQAIKYIHLLETNFKFNSGDYLFTARVHLYNVYANKNNHYKWPSSQSPSGKSASTTSKRPRHGPET